MNICTELNDRKMAVDMALKYIRELADRIENEDLELSELTLDSILNNFSSPIGVQIKIKVLNNKD